MNIEIMYKKRIIDPTDDLDPVSYNAVVVETFIDVYELREQGQYLEVSMPYRHVDKVLIDDIICIKVK